MDGKALVENLLSFGFSLLQSVFSSCIITHALEADLERVTAEKL